MLWSTSGHQLLRCLVHEDKEVRQEIAQIKSDLAISLIEVDRQDNVALDVAFFLDFFVQLSCLGKLLSLIRLKLAASDAFNHEPGLCKHLKVTASSENSFNFTPLHLLEKRVN